MTDVETTHHDLRIHRYENGKIAVQIDGKTASCMEGNIECAFLRSFEWLEDNEVHDPEGCITVSGGRLRELIEEWREKVKQSPSAYHQSDVPVLLDELEAVLEK